MVPTTCRGALEQPRVPTKIRSVPKTVGRQPDTSDVVRPSRPSAAEQSRRSWAQLIGSFPAIPDPFRGFFEKVPPDPAAFPYTVLTPAYEGFLHKETAKLICVFGLEVCILEPRGRSFTARRYPLTSISHVEITAVLLDSRIPS
jgi:hypothetical protein